SVMLKRLTEPRPKKERGISSTRQNAMNLGDNGSTFADRRGNTLSRTSPHIPHAEHAGTARLQRQYRPGFCQGTGSGIEAGGHGPFGIGVSTAIKPRRVRIGANEEEQVAQGTAIALPTQTLSKCCGSKARRLISLESRHFGPRMQHHIR